MLWCQKKIVFFCFPYTLFVSDDCADIHLGSIKPWLILYIDWFWKFFFSIKKWKKTKFQHIFSVFRLSCNQSPDRYAHIRKLFQRSSIPGNIPNRLKIKYFSFWNIFILWMWRLSWYIYVNLQPMESFFFIWLSNDVLDDWMNY